MAAAAEIEFDAVLANDASTGSIVARNATLRFNGGLTNRGSVGTSDLFGDVSTAAPLGGYVPAYGQAHRIVQAGARLDIFTRVAGIALAPDRWLAVTYDASGVNVTAALPGDANVDGIVNFQDLVLLAQQYDVATDRTWATGDLNGDGVTNFADLVALAQHYNPGVSAGTIASPHTADFAADWALAQSLVPQPGGALAAVGLAAALRRPSGR